LLDFDFEPDANAPVDVDVDVDVAFTEEEEVVVVACFFCFVIEFFDLLEIDVSIRLLENGSSCCFDAGGLIGKEGIIAGDASDDLVRAIFY